MSNEFNNLYEFDEYTLNVPERNLWCRGELISLPPKVFDTLRMLVESDGRVLTKTEMLEAIWSDTFVEEGNLSQNIYTLRRLFGKERGYIETIPKLGYRFTAPVRPIANGNTVAAVPDRVESPRTEIPSPRTANRGLIYGAIAALVVLVTTGAFLYRGSGIESNGSGEFTLRSLTDSGKAFSPAISPDGKYVAYVESGEKYSVRLKELGSGNDVEVKVGGGIVPGYLEFSRDGQEIFFRGRGLWRAGVNTYRMSYFGGTPSVVAENVWGRFSLSPDGRRMAFFRADPATNSDLLIIRDLESGVEQTLVTLTAPEQFFILVAPEWSPDGKTLAMVKRARDGDRSAIFTVRVGDGSTDEINTELSLLFDLAWKPDGRSILALSKEPEKGRQLWKVEYPSGAVSRVTNDLNMYEGISIANDGRSLVTESRTLSANIWVFSKDGKESSALTSGSYGHFGLSDLEYATEDRVIYDSRMEVIRDLWATSIKDPIQRRLTQENGTLNSYISSTSDGRYLYLSSNRDGTESIWRIGQDGSAPFKVTTARNETHWYPALSHDEKSLYYFSRAPGRSEIRQILLEDMSEKVLYGASDFSAFHFFEVSPDGRYLAFGYQGGDGEPANNDEPVMAGLRVGMLDLSGQAKIRTINLRTSKAMIRFTNGGKTFDYLRANSVVRQNTEDPAGQPETVFSLPGERIYNFDWSMAGTHIAVSRGNLTTDLVLISLPE